MVLMRSLTEFAKTTLIGGFLIIPPVYISLLLLAKATQALLALMKPITEEIPAASRSARSWQSSHWRPSRTDVKF
jgi:hypothetical protein